MNALIGDSAIDTNGDHTVSIAEIEEAVRSCHDFARNNSDVKGAQSPPPAYKLP